jgi:asparagine synthase (glutamine-hydrolysing)
MAARLGKALPNGLWDMLGGLGPKVRWRLDALASRDFESLYRYFVSHFKDPASFVLGGSEPPGILDGESMDDKWAWMSLYDLSGYLPEDILTKVDRASMAVGLEARVPLIDHRVVEFAARIPTAMKMRDGQGKWPLRQVLYRHVPQELVDRPKMGFGVPIERWMREDLRGWCEDLLSPDAIRRGGYVDAELVARMWREYLAGETNWHYYLWDVLMFQAWVETVE